MDFGVGYVSASARSNPGSRLKGAKRSAWREFLAGSRTPSNYMEAVAAFNGRLRFKIIAVTVA
jgi:hypothetical protein